MQVNLPQSEQLPQPRHRKGKRYPLRAAQFVLGAVEDGAHRKQADQGGDDTDAVHELGDAEGKPFLAGKAVQSDGRQEQAEEQNQETLEQVFAGQAGDDGQSEYGQREVLRRPERQGDAGQRFGKGKQRHDADHAADTRGHHRGGQRQAGLALFGQFITIQHGGRGRRCAGCTDRNRGDRSAVFPGHVDRDQQQHRDHRVHAEGKRHHQGDGR